MKNPEQHLRRYSGGSVHSCSDVWKFCSCHVSSHLIPTWIPASLWLASGGESETQPGEALIWRSSKAKALQSEFVLLPEVMPKKLSII